MRNLNSGFGYNYTEFRFRLQREHPHGSQGSPQKEREPMTPVTETKPPAGAKPAAIERVLRADARRNREAVVAAAKKLFADQGLDAQMPDVAKAAKVGVGTVYRHFPTKEDLIAALAAERFERLAEKAREGIAAEDPWEGLCEFIRFAARIQADDRGLCEVMGSRPEVMNVS